MTDESQVLARWYASLLNLLEQAGEDEVAQQIAESAEDELDATGWALLRGPDGWRAVDESQDEDEDEDEDGYELSASDHPIGQAWESTSHPGRYFVRKQFGEKVRVVPAKNPNAAAKTSVKQRMAQRIAKGSVDRQKLSERLGKHAEGHSANALQKAWAKSAARMFKRYHGEHAIHRIEDLADTLEGVLERLGNQEGWRAKTLRDSIQGKLRQLHVALSYLDSAPEKGVDSGAKAEPERRAEPAVEPGRGADVGRVDGSSPGGTAGSRIVTARAEKTKPGNPELVSQSLRGFLNDHQVEGVAKAIEAMDKHGGFLLADGTGVGKTRQQLAIAQTYAEKGHKVLIVSKSGAIKPKWDKKAFAGSFADDSEAMGISLSLTDGESPLEKGKIVLTTYDKLGKIKDKVDSNTVILWDESHSLKNWGAQRSKDGSEMNKVAKAVMYATATPADKPLHIAHLFKAKVFGGRKWEDTYRELGMHQVEVRTPGKTIKKWEINPRVGAAEVYRRMSGLFDRMTEEGLMLKREISFGGVDVGIQRIELPPDAYEVMDRVKREISKRGGNSGLIRAQILMTQRRQQETYKIPATVEHTLKELKEGRQVVVFASRVNESTVGEKEDPNSITSEGTMKLLREQLEAAGVAPTDIAELHGGITKGKQAKAMEAFQAGKAKVIVATVESGGTGINLDDVVGDKPRTLLMMTAPFSAVENVQAAGRVWRLKTKSLPRIRYLFADTEVDNWNASLIAGKMKALGAAVSGEVGFLDVANMDVSEEEEIDRMDATINKKEEPKEPYQWPSLIGGRESSSTSSSEPAEDKVIVSGKTYDNREYIKSAGGKYNGDGTWTLPKSAVEDLNDIDGLIFRDISKAAPATPAPATPAPATPAPATPAPATPATPTRKNISTREVKTKYGRKHVYNFKADRDLETAYKRGRLPNSVTVKWNDYTRRLEATIWGDSPEHAQEVYDRLVDKGYTLSTLDDIIVAGVSLEHLRRGYLSRTRQ